MVIRTFRIRRSWSLSVENIRVFHGTILLININRLFLINRGVTREKRKRKLYKIGTVETVGNKRTCTRGEKYLGFLNFNPARRSKIHTWRAQKPISVSHFSLKVQHIYIVCITHIISQTVQTHFFLSESLIHKTV